MAGNKALRGLLFDLGMKQRQLARASGVTQPIISGIIRGRINARPDEVKRICRALRVTPEEAGFVVPASSTSPLKKVEK